MVPTESKKDGIYLNTCDNITDMLIDLGHLVHVILVAVVCDKPATYKIVKFTLHSHTNLCTLCWISICDKTKADTSKKGSVFSAS